MCNDTLIIIPAYNEEENIETVLKNVINEIKKNHLQNNIDILVVDDCSTDKTYNITKKSNVKIIRNIKNIGYGGALQIGYRYAIKKNYNYVIQMDSDGQHDPINIINLFENIHDGYADIILGNRFLKSNIKISKFKKFAIKYFSFILHQSSGIKINDPTSGLQALNKTVTYYFSRYNQFDSVYPDSNILLEASKAGFKIREIPVIMHDRVNGESIFSGLRPIYYMMYMTIATISVLFKKDIKQRYNNAIEYTNGVINGAQQ